MVNKKVGNPASKPVPYKRSASTQAKGKTALPKQRAGTSPGAAGQAANVRQRVTGTAKAAVANRTGNIGKAP